MSGGEWQGPVGYVPHDQIDSVLAAMARAGELTVPDTVEMEDLDRIIVSSAAAIVCANNLDVVRNVSQHVRGKPTDTLESRGCPLPRSALTAESLKQGATAAGLIVAGRTVELRPADMSLPVRALSKVMERVEQRIGPRAITTGQRELLIASKKIISTVHGREFIQNFGPTSGPFLWYAAALLLGRQGIKSPTLASGVAVGLYESWLANQRVSYPERLRGSISDISSNLGNMKDIGKRQYIAASRPVISELGESLPLDTSAGQRADFAAYKASINFGRILAEKMIAMVPKKDPDAEEPVVAAEAAPNVGAERETHLRDTSVEYGKTLLTSPRIIAGRLRVFAEDETLPVDDQTMRDLAVLREQSRAGAVTAREAYPALLTALMPRLIRLLHSRIPDIQNGFGRPEDLIMIDGLGTKKVAESYPDQPDLAEKVKALKRSLVQAACAHFGSTTAGTSALLKAHVLGYLFETTAKGNPNPRTEFERDVLAAVTNVRIGSYHQWAQGARRMVGSDPLPDRMAQTVDTYAATTRSHEPGRIAQVSDKLRQLVIRALPAGADSIMVIVYDERGVPVGHKMERRRPGDGGRAWRGR